MGQLALAGLVPDLFHEAVPKVQPVGNLHVQRPDGGLLVGADGDGDRHLIAAAHRGGDGGGAGATARHVGAADLGDVGVGGLPDRVSVGRRAEPVQGGQSDHLILRHLQVGRLGDDSADGNLDILFLMVVAGADGNGHLRLAGALGIDHAVAALAVGILSGGDLLILRCPRHRLGGGFDVLALAHVHDKGPAGAQVDACHPVLNRDSAGVCGGQRT